MCKPIEALPGWSFKFQETVGVVKKKKATGDAAVSKKGTFFTLADLSHMCSSLSLRLWVPGKYSPDLLHPFPETKDQKSFLDARLLTAFAGLDHLPRWAEGTGTGPLKSHVRLFVSPYSKEFGYKT